MTEAIAIVGMACRYPDARSPQELWENTLAQRRAFRRLPDERLRLADYYSRDRSVPDSTYSTEAALIEGYEFDRLRFRVSGATYRSADLTHWLALETTEQALIDAAWEKNASPLREKVGVFIGNTLTGEFARANLMRLRWPYVRRVFEAELIAEGWPVERVRSFLSRVEATYKSPFPPIGEETLAGGLSNTIAGRICNYFDFKGGGYTVDGACASSLLAVAQACAALSNGDLDFALAGGVDLSIDPFEIIGFSKAGALAEEKMRVYDARSNGFWPGEGCGVVALMRREDAIAQGKRVYASIRGWGISSDGSGGITRPEVHGQQLAITRAYHRAGFGIETVGYFEGHGTGTSVGDATELKALSQLLQRQGGTFPPPVISSVKANIGHTKAAAGAAGLINATMAVHTQILPPAAAYENPNPELSADAAKLRLLRQGELWAKERPLRAGVSAMGFGGINVHVAIEGENPVRRQTMSRREHTLCSSAQDAELLVFSAPDAASLSRQIASLLSFAPKLARSEITDIAAHLANALEPATVRAAIVASSPAELVHRLQTLNSLLDAGETACIDARAGVFLGTGDSPPRIGFLFPGQGAPVGLDGGAWSRRFGYVGRLFEEGGFGSARDSVATEVAQPAIATASVAGLQTLSRVGITARVAIGHSLGELIALHWAGAIEEDALLRITAARGKAMAALGHVKGAMASISAGEQAVAGLLDGEYLSIAGLNSPRQTVISGEANAVAECVSRARSAGLSAVSLPVSHAFHSQLMAPAASALARELAGEFLRPLKRPVISTVTGERLAPNQDLQALLLDQLVQPVRFIQAAEKIAADADLLIEVGPGHVLSGLVADFINVPALSVDASGSSLQGLLQVVGAAFALGATVNLSELFVDRFARPFDLTWRPRFLINPCETVAPPGEEAFALSLSVDDFDQPQPAEQESDSFTEDLRPGASIAPPIETLRRLVAEYAELPLEAVNDEARLLGDLHLNSITVSQIVVEAARRLELPPPLTPTDYSTVTLMEAAVALETLASTDRGRDDQNAQPPGVDAWVRAFTVETVERPRLAHKTAEGSGQWTVVAPTDHPFAGRLGEALNRFSGRDGIAVCLPPKPDESHIPLLLEGAKQALSLAPGGCLLLVQHGGGAASFARTLRLESPDLTTCVVDIPQDHPQTVEWALAEARAAFGHVEAIYDASGRRSEPVLRALPMTESLEAAPLERSDVLLVTGGGKGIAAESALYLAQETGASLALLGRSHARQDAELAANLDRLSARGIRFRYYAADLCDAEATRKAIQLAESELGPITALLHGAGINTPRALSSLDEAAFQHTLQPKLQGLRNTMAALNLERLRLLITFGSLIARTGMHGEADYAVANEWLTRLTEQWQAELLHCRCLAIEWSVWSGVGMGQRLSSIEALRRQGIMPIPPDQGVRILYNLLRRPLPSASVVVTGRFGEAPTLKIDQPALPFLRFLERTRVYYPGVELIVEADLKAETDPYLDDHVLQQERLLPAVIGLESMAQAACGLMNTEQLPVFEMVRFDRPIVARETVTVRIAALLRSPNTVEVVLRSSETGFQVDHFRAVCRFGAATGNDDPFPLPAADPSRDENRTMVMLDPLEDLYGKVLFHRGRFRRLRGYRVLRARECMAEIAPGSDEGWFSRYLPQSLLLGDPGARDAAIHAIQACIPQATLLPIGVDRIFSSRIDAAAITQVVARERSRDGDTFTYDMELKDCESNVRERWEGLRLRLIGQLTTPAPWAAALIGPYLERRLEELIPGSGLNVAISKSPEMNGEWAVHQLMGVKGSLRRRGDGKPELSHAPNASISFAHAGSLTLAVAGFGTVGCDLELSVNRPGSLWRDLLGEERMALSRVIAIEAKEDPDAAATRVWAASECLKKSGAIAGAPLVFSATTSDQWVLLTSGRSTIATYSAHLRELPGKLLIAVLFERANQTASI